MTLFIVLSAKYLVYPIALAGLGVLWIVWSWRNLLFALCSLALSYALGILGGHLWYNARPFMSDGIQPLFTHAANNGFPSDHTLLGVAVASIVFAWNRTLGVVLLILALWVGAARVLSGIHHIVDILGAAVIAILSTAVVSWALKRFFPR
ncbi:MAG: phosphatase PAP2 family protein [Patescibacteria group bacterium]|nr:phosphatase PAP2 family protein [Patescibacteria group bacterium]